MPLVAIQIDTQRCSVHSCTMCCLTLIWSQSQLPMITDFNQSIHTYRKRKREGERERERRQLCCWDVDTLTSGQPQYRRLDDLGLQDVFSIPPS